MPGPIAYKALVAVVIDTSGSVSDEAITVAVQEVLKISKLQPDVALYLVTHDSSVQWKGWIKGGKAESLIKTAVKGRGGTYFTPAYRAIEATRKRFDAMVHLTDGLPNESNGWPAKPKNVKSAVAALIGDATSVYIPVGWRKVEVEIDRSADDGR